MLHHLRPQSSCNSMQSFWNHTGYSIYSHKSTGISFFGNPGTVFKPFLMWEHTCTSSSWLEQLLMWSSVSLFKSTHDGSSSGFREMNKYSEHQIISIIAQRCKLHKAYFLPVSRKIATFIPFYSYCKQQKSFWICSQSFFPSSQLQVVMVLRLYLRFFSW